MTDSLRLMMARIRAFAAETRGSLSMEAVIVLPLLAWAYVGMFTFFDAYRTRNSAEKAAYVVSDAMTRITDGVNEDFIDGMKDLMGFLTHSNGATTLRVSEIQWRKDFPNDPDSDAGAYYMTWSYAADDGAILDDDTLATMTGQIPKLQHAERLVLVEAGASWAPIFNVGLDARSFDYFVPTSPRFATQVAWDGASTSLGTEMNTLADEPNAGDEIDEEDDEDTQNAVTCRWYWWYCY